MQTSTTPITPTTTSKFHFSLWVNDLDRTIAFYRALFGQEPHKVYADYAKFEVTEPPLVVSFLPQPAPRGASLNHVGLRLPDSAGLVEMQRRLERAGYPTTRQDGVECCYALQTKFWATDPDGVQWEVYTIHKDIERYGSDRAPKLTRPVVEPQPTAAHNTWSHTLPDTFPEQLPFPDASLDEVSLLNTFNAVGGAPSFSRTVAEAIRVLRAGGRLFIRGLTGDRPYPGAPDFPGLSAKYKYVPVPTEPLAVLAAAGFHGIEIESWKDVGCIKDSSGVAFRTLTASAWKASASGVPTVTARYDGPFSRLTDDDGTVFPRGVAVPVPADRAERLRNGPAGTAFTFATL